MAITSGTTMTLVSNWLKEKYQGNQAQFLFRSDEWRMFKNLGQDGNMLKDGASDKFIFNTNDTLVGGFGKASATGALPTRQNNPDPSKFQIALAEYYLTLCVRNDTIEEANKRMIVNTIADQIQTAERAFDDFMGSAFIGDGYGSLTNITGAAASATAPDSDFLDSGTACFTVPVEDVASVYKGQYCEILNASHTQVANDVKILGASVAQGRGNLYVGSATTLSSSSLTTGFTLNMQNSSASGSVNPHGIDEAVGKTGYYPSSAEGGWDRAAANHSTWRSEVIDMTNDSDFVGASLFKTCHIMANRLAFHGKQQSPKKKGPNAIMKPVQLILGDPNALSMLSEEAREFRRYSGETYVPDLAMVVEKVFGCPLVPNQKFRAKLYFLDMRYWYAMDMPFQWRGGQRKNLFIPDPDTVWNVASGWLKFNIHCQYLRGQGKIIGIPVETFDPSLATD